MKISPASSMKENYDEIVNLCRKTQEPIFLTENGEMDLVIMDIETFKRKEKNVGFT